MLAERTARRRAAWSRSQDGAVAVEFALVLPVLVMLLLGVTTTGISYSHAIGAASAAKGGIALRRHRRRHCDRRLGQRCD